MLLQIMLIHSLYLLKTLFIQSSPIPRRFCDCPDTVPRADTLARRRFLVLQLYRYRIVKELPIDPALRQACRVNGWMGIDAQSRLDLPNLSRGAAILSQNGASPFPPSRHNSLAHFFLHRSY